jgi:hypothetical protein
MKTKGKEVVLGGHVVAWLEAEGWDVFQEVQPHGGAVADIVALRSGILIVVELKASPTFDLLDQTLRWKPYAHQVYGAVPKARASNSRHMAIRVFGQYGVGLFEVDQDALSHSAGRFGFRGYFRTVATPSFNRKANAEAIRSKLRPEHKTFAKAGSAQGGHFTEFKATCETLRAHVAKNEGTTIKDAIANMAHHYSTDASAKAHLVKLIERGVVDGIRCERDAKRKARLYVADVKLERSKGAAK